jgi:hypothetical protein
MSASIKSAKLTERVEGLEKIKAKAADVRSREIARLDALKLRTTEEHRAEEASADAAFAARADELDRALAGDIRKKLYPLAERFVAGETRVAAKAIAELWRALEKRALEELGEELPLRHISLALLTAMGDEAADRGASDAFSGYVSGRGGLTEVLTSGAGAAAVEGALRDLEEKLARALGVAPIDVTQPNPARLKALQGAATTGRMMEAARAHDLSVKAAAELAERPAREAHASAMQARMNALQKVAIVNESRQQKARGVFG